MPYFRGVNFRRLNAALYLSSSGDECMEEWEYGEGMLGDEGEKDGCREREKVWTWSWVMLFREIC